jgi:AcrR family transcriptional regulator
MTSEMSSPKVGGMSDEAKPYHHGDLSRALIDAARAMLETEGPGALSLRAVAREAGVSPAAPYHHFKDKDELLDAVAQQGWDLLSAALAQAKQQAISPATTMAELGVAYVRFARENPALYRVMYDMARNKAALPERLQNEDGAYCRVRGAIVEAGADAVDAHNLELLTIAGWCHAHGVAEMAGFPQFDPIREACGGEAAFVRALFDRMVLKPKP